MVRIAAIVWVRKEWSKPHPIYSNFRGYWQTQYPNFDESRDREVNPYLSHHCMIR